MPSNRVADALKPDTIADALTPEPIAAAPAVAPAAAVAPVGTAPAAAVSSQVSAPDVAASKTQAAQSPTAYPGTPIQSPPEALKQPLNSDEGAAYKEMLGKGFSEYEARYHATTPPGRVFPEGTPDPWRSSEDEEKTDKPAAVDVTSTPATGILKLTPELIQRVLSDPQLSQRLKEIMKPTGGSDYDADLTKAAQRASNAGQ